MNDEQIFSIADNIDFQQYKLLKEEREQTDIPNVEVVTETYGYAPNKTYMQYSSDMVDKYGIEDTAGYLKFYSNVCVYNVSESTFTLTVADAEQAKLLGVGDMIRAEWLPALNYYPAYSASVPILEKVSETKIKVPAFEVTFKVSNATATKEETAAIINNKHSTTWKGWRGSTGFVRDTAVTLPKTEMTTIYNKINFYTSFPELEQKHKVLLGNAETDTITSGTIPNLEEWKQMIATGDFINVNDATVDMLYPNTLYKKTLKQMKVR